MIACSSLANFGIGATIQYETRVDQAGGSLGHRIEGVKQGEGMLLGVTPSRPDMS
jgi:hypothetical protein